MIYLPQFSLLKHIAVSISNQTLFVSLFTMPNIIIVNRFGITIYELECFPFSISIPKVSPLLHWNVFPFLLSSQRYHLYYIGMFSLSIIIPKVSPFMDWNVFPLYRHPRGITKFALECFPLFLSSLRYHQVCAGMFSPSNIPQRHHQACTGMFSPSNIPKGITKCALECFPLLISPKGIINLALEIFSPFYYH